jgi:peptidoglycan/xylan/chitin deacetylase (PgdA/CDA1 family)
MAFGGHGYAHVRLDRLSDESLKEEIERTRRFLSDCVGEGSPDWAMCYPYGAYNANVLSVLEAAGCSIGLTTRPEVVADLETPLDLGRLNTNDLPPRGPGVIRGS